MAMVVGRLWLVALLAVGAVLLAACSEPLEDAIARAEAGYVSMDRDARQLTIDDLKGALDSDAEITTEDRGRAAAWLGVLLVRHGRWEEARALLTDFDATADQLIAAGDPGSAVRGLGALGNTLVGLQLDFDAGRPLQRALAVARERNLMTDPVVIDALVEMAWLTYLPGVGGNERATRAEATTAAEAMLGQAAAIVRTDGTPDDPRLGTIDLIRANVLVVGPLDPKLSPEAFDDFALDAAVLLEAALTRLPADHPHRVGAAAFLAEIAAGFCEAEEVDRWSLDAVNTAQIIYGNKAQRTFRAREAHGGLLMQLGDVTRGRQIILDARKVHYADGGENLQDPANSYENDDTIRRCIDPPR